MKSTEPTPPNRQIRALGSRQALDDLQAALKNAGIECDAQPPYESGEGIVANAVQEMLKIILSKETAEILTALAVVIHQVRQMRRGRMVRFTLQDRDKAVVLDADKLTPQQMTSALKTCRDIVVFDPAEPKTALPHQETASLPTSEPKALENHVQR